MISNGKPSIVDKIQLLYLGLIYFPSHSENTSCVTKQINCVFVKNDLHKSSSASNCLQMILYLYIRKYL